MSRALQAEVAARDQLTVRYTSWDEQKLPVNHTVCRTVSAEDQACAVKLAKHLASNRSFVLD
jgi:hypothetical protein